MFNSRHRAGSPSVYQNAQRGAGPLHWPLISPVTGANQLEVQDSGGEAIEMAEGTADKRG